MMKPGTVSWFDLTVPDADPVRDFYREVVGWSTSNIDMGGYNDYCMIPPEAEAPVAGICHARGGNAGLPPQWLIYINVVDLDASVAKCLERGGTVIAGPKAAGEQGRYCIIRDPAGAHAGLWEPKK